MITQANLDHHRIMAAYMEPHLPMSADLLHRLLAEVEKGSALGELVSSHPDANVPLFVGRALAGVKYLMLTGRAPTLQAHLHEHLSCRDESAYANRTWELWREVAMSNTDVVSAALGRPVQQHHPRRAGMLVRGLGMLAEPTVRLLELGACAGLTLIPDMYRWIGADGQWGDEQSSVRLEAPRGPLPRQVEIVERAGCDLNPLSARDPGDMLILRSFHPHELEVAGLELDDAIELAATRNIAIDKANAVDWLENELADRVKGVYTVVWHSFFMGFLSPAEQDALEQIMLRAARRMRLANICLEPRRLGEPEQLQVRILS